MKDLLALQRAGKASEEELLDCLVEDARGRDPLEDRAESAAFKRDENQWTPLHWAAHYGHEQLAAKLLQLRVSANAADACGATPLMLAAFHGHAGVVEVLLQEPTLDINQLNLYLSSAVHYAAHTGHATIIDMLYEAKAEVDSTDSHSDTPLSWAARKGHLEAVKKLLELGADPLKDNNASEDSIELAEAAGHTDVVEVLEATVSSPSFHATFKKLLR